jgi:coenzyme F420-0:L-glutamate ligase/coenzyme F420-1:gamma-L-glutamate ligase
VITSLTIRAVDGIGEIVPGDDVAGIIHARLAEPLVAGDVVVVTSKIVSKAAGLTTRGDRDDLLDVETDRVVARRGPTRIVRTHGGLTLAAAGIDASNVEAGSVIALPRDPDADARALRDRLVDLSGVEIAVIVTDTAGRAWRTGQTDIAIGAAGIHPSLSFDGVTDAYGNPLVVTAPAVADEIAGAADLVAGKLGGRPAVVVSGLPAELLDPAAPGAASLIRPEDGDLFGLGARDAVLAALGHGDEASRGFPAAEPDDDLAALAREGIDPELVDVRRDGEVVTIVAMGEGPGAWIAAGRAAERVRVLARALRQDVAIVIRD